MSLEVFAADEQTTVPVDTVRWVRLARRILEAEGVRGDAELSMLFIDEDSMTDLNRRFLGSDGPTDVLAFPLDDEEVEHGRVPDSGGPGPGANNSERSDVPLLLGDVVICPAVAQRNAPSHTGTYEDEMALLVVHGILHLLGMDHADEQDATEMQQRERELLERFHQMP